LELFKTHVEVVQAYFVAFKSVQTQLADNQKILADCLGYLYKRHEVIDQNTRQAEANASLSAENLRMQEESIRLQAAKELLQRENTRIQDELEARKAELTSNKQRIVDLEADLAAQKEANRALFAEKTTAEVECDALQANLDRRDAELAEKNMRIDNLEEVLEIPDSAALFHGLNLEILGGFALVLGVAVVALALTALMLTPMAPLVPIGITLAGAGLATAGFFGMRQGILQQHQEALHERTL